MRTMRDIEACLYVGPCDRTTLERLVADGKTPQKIVKRAKIVLLSGWGAGTDAIMREARVSKPTVCQASAAAFLFLSTLDRLIRPFSRA
jgi:hypothetical protein